MEFKVTIPEIELARVRSIARLRLLEIEGLIRENEGLRDVAVPCLEGQIEVSEAVQSRSVPEAGVDTGTAPEAPGEAATAPWKEIANRRFNEWQGYRLGNYDLAHATAKEAYEVGRGLGYKKGFERGIAEAGKRAADEADEAWNAGCIREQVREARRATTCEMAKGSSAAAAGWCRCSYCEGRDDALNELLDKLEGKSLKGGETTLGAPFDKVVDLAADSGGIQGCEMLPIYGTRDAKTWAEQYLKWVDGRGFSILPGEEYETFRWFANAIGTGFDLGVKSEAKRNSLKGGDAP